MAKYQVTVTAVSDQIVSLVKSLRLVGDLGLKDAKDIADYLSANLPCVLVAGIDQEVADHIAGLLRDAGTTARAEESPLTAPLLLCPGANHRYRWSWLGTRTEV
jgi:ribosomal protein L7/L12